MKYLDLTFDEPEANLACDEALLERMDADPFTDACLRVWQAKNHFVVLGHSNRWFSETNISVCNEKRIPILRRISGGGTVMQGPGCLNYSLILRSGARQLKNIGDTFTYVLQRHRLLVNEICRAKNVRIQGMSDLTIDGRKFSGNAQYRKSSCVLVHGTFLLSFDLKLIDEYLSLPAKQPAYRKARPHLEFVANLNVDPLQVCERLKTAWQAKEDSYQVPFARVEELVCSRYSRPEWSKKF
ncbi:MAG TPA: lipoate--protein ligase family protein [Candidatus Binatia bacterium]